MLKNSRYSPGKSLSRPTKKNAVPSTEAASAKITATENQSPEA